MAVATFTLVHVILSLVGILTGLVVLAAMLVSRPFSGWTALFLATTVLTSVTGFFFPRDHVLPSHIVGALSLVLLVLAIAALYRYRLARAWRWIYVSTAIAALYLNVFVLVVQAFAKIPVLSALAPTQAEPPFVITQGVVLLAFIAFGTIAVRSFRPADGGAALHPA